MKYKKAEQLKQLGFPQLKGMGEGRYLFKEKQQSAVEREEYIRKYPDRVAYYPTLEDLFFYIGKSPNFTKLLFNNYKTKDGYFAVGDEGIRCDGKTPEEALVCFWIKLNQ